MNSTTRSTSDKESITNTYSTRTKAVLEVLIVYSATLGLLWLSQAYPDFGKWQDKIFGRELLTSFIVFVLIPISAIWLHKSNETHSLVMHWNNFKKAFKSASKALIVMIPVTMFSFPVVAILGYSFLEWNGGLIIAGWHLVAIPCLCLLFKKSDSVNELNLSTGDLLKILSVLVFSAALIYGLQFVSVNASEVIVAMIFVGFVEEFMFRGYIQGRLNQAFGKPFTVLGFSFGWGLLVASLLFGLMHSLSPPAPLHLSWGFWTFIAGICFGIIREKGGSFLASAIVHGIIVIFPIAFGNL